MKQDRKRGFTLAELLIVVAIIGVLAAIAIPLFQGQLEKARIATDDANIRAAYAMFRGCETAGVIAVDETAGGEAQAPAADGQFFFTPDGTLTKNIANAYKLQADHDGCELFSTENSGAFKHQKGAAITIIYTQGSDHWSFAATPATP